MGSSWTPTQNKVFERALALYERDTPDRWQNVADMVCKSVEDVKQHYEILKEDVRGIELGKVHYLHTQQTLPKTPPHASIHLEFASVHRLLTVFRVNYHQHNHTTRDIDACSEAQSLQRQL